jgi:hypothetical protein
LLESDSYKVKFMRSLGKNRSSLYITAALLACAWVGVVGVKPAFARFIDDSCQGVNSNNVRSEKCAVKLAEQLKNTGYTPQTNNCEIYDLKPQLRSDHKGHGRTLDGSGGHDEIPDCPTVDCGGSDAIFTKHVEDYFNYTPPQNNRKILEQLGYIVDEGDRFDTSDSKKQIKHAGETMRSKGDCDTNTEANEPCAQDNRTRDMCLQGGMPTAGDLGYAANPTNFKMDEEPWPGVAGSKPLNNPDDKEKINCLPPKTTGSPTEQISPLTFDNGWRYRYMCPGDALLRRVPNDEYAIKKTDPFHGLYNCFVPAPKCNLPSDGYMEGDIWKNDTSKSFKQLFQDSAVAGVVARNGERTAATLLSALNDTQKKTVRDLIGWWDEPNNKIISRSPECKPAFWVRFMMDNCANQFIAQNAPHPLRVFNPDAAGTGVGISPRYCQVLRTEGASITWDGASVMDYNAQVYLKRAAEAILMKDYMPWIDYGNLWYGTKAGAIYKEWQDRHNITYKDTQIRALDEYAGVGSADVKEDFQKKYTDEEMYKVRSTQRIPHNISAFAQMGVERVLDATHPFSPRYDIALYGDSDKKFSAVLDRGMFIGSTDTPMAMNSLIGKCLPTQTKGYFEYPRQLPNGEAEDCTVYCSAVDVDVLRFRYADYRICMGCHIDANSNAFWKEVELNTEVYAKQRCYTDSYNPAPNQNQTNDFCNYGVDVCGSCGKYPAECAACDSVGKTCPECEIHKKACNTVCNPPTARDYTEKPFPYQEAVERARKRINRLDKPDYGPTATQLDGETWPVCSTRFDLPHNKELCKQAKVASGSCAEQVEIALKRDENVDRDGEIDPVTQRKINTPAQIAARCLEKDVGQVCGEVAGPVIGLNFLKIRPTKDEKFLDSADAQFANKINGLARADGSVNPPDIYHFRQHFGNHRPYMRWWDTGNESFQNNTENARSDTPKKPDYFCDWGANDTYIGVGRDYNSIHSKNANICAYSGGNDAGDGRCFTPAQWKQAGYSMLGGTEWAELKMYQTNCYKTKGLNCLCSYEKVFKPLTGEDAVLLSHGGTQNVPQSFADKDKDGNDVIRTETLPVRVPLGWRGYASSPYGKDTQFPYLYTYEKDLADVFMTGLDFAQAGDIVVWPADGALRSTLPRVGQVVRAENNASKDGVALGHGYVVIEDMNNGQLPDTCGNTTMLGYGPERRIFATKEDMFKYHDPKGDNQAGSTPQRIREQVVSTYDCEDPSLPVCVEKFWNAVRVYRTSQEKVR